MARFQEWEERILRAKMVMLIEGNEVTQEA